MFSQVTFGYRDPFQGVVGFTCFSLPVLRDRGPIVQWVECDITIVFFCCITFLRVDCGKLSACYLSNHVQGLVCCRHNDSEQMVGGLLTSVLSFSSSLKLF